MRRALLTWRHALKLNNLFFVNPVKNNPEMMLYTPVLLSPDFLYPHNVTSVFGVRTVRHEKVHSQHNRERSAWIWTTP